MKKENNSSPVSVSEQQSDKTGQTQDKSKDLSMIVVISESIIISKNDPIYSCPKCKKKVDSITKYKTSGQTIIAALAASFLCCCCIPILIKDCKDQQQVCPTCRSVLEEKKYQIC